MTGQGVTGKIGERPEAMGDARLMAGLGIALGDLEQRAEVLRTDGAMVPFPVVDGKPGGLIAIADPIKATIHVALDQLRCDGIRIVMLTGDNRMTAAAVARKLRIEDVEAEVLPEDKGRMSGSSPAKAVSCRGDGGDGVNDAPALARPRSASPLGTGTDVANQSAGITLVNGGLAAIARAVTLSRATMRNIRQNLVFAPNGIGISITAGVFYPAFGPLLSPIVAALAMSLSSVSVIANALRLRGLKL